MYHGSAMSVHLYRMIYNLYGYHYRDALGNFVSSVEDVVEAASTRHGRVFYMRHWHYEGSHQWN